MSRKLLIEKHGKKFVAALLSASLLFTGTLIGVPGEVGQEEVLADELGIKVNAQEEMMTAGDDDNVICYYDFDTEGKKPSDYGFWLRPGCGGHTKITKGEQVSGKYSLCNYNRTHYYSGINFSVKDYAGEAIIIEAKVKSSDAEICLTVDDEPSDYPHLVKLKTYGEWKDLTAEYEVPADGSCSTLLFEAWDNYDGYKDTRNIYIDNFKISYKRKQKSIRQQDRTINMSVGGSRALGATTVADERLVYTSSDSNIITVNENGVVSAVGAGTATVTINSPQSKKYLAANPVVVTINVAANQGGGNSGGGNSGGGNSGGGNSGGTTPSVPVIEPTPAANGKFDKYINYSVVEYYKKVGDADFSLDAVTVAGEQLVYSSSNEAAVRVDSSGRVSVIGAGTSTITISSPANSQYNEAAPVRVKIVVEALQDFEKTSKMIKTRQKKYNLVIGSKSFTLGAKNTAMEAMQFSSSNKNVATVSKKGVVKIKGIGKAIITVVSPETDLYQAATPLKVPVTVVPKSAKIKSATNSSSKTINVTWKTVKDATGYQIRYSTNKNFKKSKTVNAKSAKTASASITKLQKGKTYYVKVRAYKKVGKKNFYSEYSDTKKVKIAR